MRLRVPILLAFLLCGCVAPAVQPVPPVVESASILHGFVLDDEQRPVPSARIVAGPLVTTSGSQGEYELAGLAPGRTSVLATHPGFAPTSVDVNILEGTSERRDLVLVRLPAPAHFNETFPYHGRFDCAWDLLILGGDCMVLYRNLTGQDDPVTNEEHAFRLPVRTNWSRIEVNVSWQMAGENQFEGMRLYLEHGNGSKHGHATSVAYEEGATSPVTLVLERGVVHPNAENYENTKTKARLSEAGEELQIRVFPRGRLSSEMGSVCHEGRCFLGVGLGLELDFNVQARVSYAP